MEHQWARLRGHFRKSQSPSRRKIGRRLDWIDIHTRRLGVEAGLIRGRLPDFLIVGAQKCGTTSLARSLQTHPDVYMAHGHAGSSHEVHFFDKEHRREHGGESFYRSFFRSPNQLQGEKTPTYLYRTDQHKHIHDMLPHAKLIVTLRNPVDRAYSNWNHMLQTKRIPAMSFECAFESVSGLRGRGKYDEHIESLMRFYPREQLLVLILEHMREEPERGFTRVLDFLDLRPLEEATYSVRHRREYASSMEPTTRRRLLEEFAPGNARLERMLGFEIPEWRE